MALELLFNVKDLASKKVKDLNNNLSVLDKTTQSTTKHFNTMTNDLVKMGTAYLTVQGMVDLSKTFIKNADAMTLMNTKLRLNTSSTLEFVNAQEQLFKIAQDTRSQLDGTIDLYSRIARSTRDYNIEQKDLLDLTETINKAMILSGGSAESVNAAVIQLGQAFSSDFQAVGQELGSIREQAPRLYQALLEGTGKTSKEFKKLAEDGKLSSQIIIKAIQDQSKAVDTEFNATTKTVSQSMTQINTSMTSLVGNIDNAIGLTSGLSDTFTSLSQLLDINNKDIVEWSITAMAYMGSLGDSINFVYETLENTGQGIVYSLNISVYGALKSITYLAKSATEALNAIGLSSDDTLSNITNLYASIDKQYKNAQKGLSESIDEVRVAYDKASVSIEDRIALMKAEAKLRDDIAKVNAKLKKQQDELNKKPKSLESILKIQQDINKVLDPQQAAIDKINKKYDEYKTKLIEAKVPAADLFDLEEARQKELSKFNVTEVVSTSLQSWQDYYTRIGDLNTAWLIQEAQLRTKFVDLEEDQFKKLAESYKKEFLDKMYKDIKPITIDVRVTGFDELSDGLAKGINGFADMIDANAEYNALQKQGFKTSKDRTKAEMSLATSTIGGFADMTTGLASFYDEDDDRRKRQLELAKVMNAAKMAMQIAEMSQSAAFTQLFVADETVKAQAAGTTAVMVAAQSSPWTGFATAAAMAAMVASFGVMLSGSGGSFTPPSTSVGDLGANTELSSIFADVPTIDEDTSLEDAINKLEKTIEVQNKLYESMGDFGGTFENTFKEGTADLLSSLTDAMKVSDYDAMLKNTPQNSLLSFDLGELTTTSMDLSGNVLNTKQYDDLIDFLYALTDINTAFDVDYANFGGYTEIEQDISDALDDYTLSLLDLEDEMVDYRDTWIDIYEGMTNDTKYTTAKLNEAFTDVADLQTQVGANSIDELYTTLIDAYDVDWDELKSMYDSSSQAEFIQYLTDSFPQMELDPANVYDFVDALDLVGEALTTSNDNIKEWEDSFKSSEQLLQDQVAQYNKLNGSSIAMATSTQELDNLYNTLANDTFGLTDAELDLLNANKDYIDSLNEVAEATSNATYITTIENDIQRQFQDLINAGIEIDRTNQRLEDFENTLLGIGISADDINSDNIQEYYNQSVSSIKDFYNKQRELQEETTNLINKQLSDINNIKDYVNRIRTDQLIQTYSTSTLKDKFYGSLGGDTTTTLESVDDYLTSLEDTAVSMDDFAWEQGKTLSVLEDLSGQKEITLQDLDDSLMDLDANEQLALEDLKLSTIETLEDLQSTNDSLLKENANSILSLEDQVVQYLGEDSLMVEWLKSIDGSINSIDFATFNNQIELNEAVEGLSNYLISSDTSTIGDKTVTTDVYQIPDFGTQTTVTTSTPTYTAYTTSTVYDDGTTSTLSGGGIVPTSIPSVSSPTLSTEDYPGYEITPFADGGIITAPTIGLIGEAGYNEAVIPLKDPNDPLGMGGVEQRLQHLEAILVELLTNGVKSTRILERIENNGLISLSEDN